MKTAFNLHAGPVEDARLAHRAALAALGEAVARSGEVWRRRVHESHAPVPGLTWTVSETAAHVVGDLADYTDALIRRANGTIAAEERPSGSPSRRSAAINAQHLTTVWERDLERLADMLDEQATRYLAVATEITDAWDVPTPNGLVLSPATMTSLLLGEQLLHGLDIARATDVSWSISRHDALLVIPGMLAAAPRYVHPIRSADVHVSYELRIRGGGRYRLAVHDGTGDITGAGERADCVISADPVAFLLLGYGRITQWLPIIQGKLTVWGRKPWLAVKFATLQTRP